MAIYTIIGGDNKEYGPITDNDVRQWLAEGLLKFFKGRGAVVTQFEFFRRFPA